MCTSDFGHFDCPSRGLKVLHIWNTANIGGLIARYMDRMKGTDSVVYMWERWDPFRAGNEKVILYRTAFGNKIGKLKTPFLAFKGRHFDLIHNHGLDGLTPWLRLLYPKKKIILHYHGTRVRGKWDQKRKFWRYADRILVSTPDLLEGAPEGVLYVPNLIDWDTIDELRENTEDKCRGAFTVSRWCDDEARKIAEAHELSLIYHDREKYPMSHKDFLKVLNQFTAYIDIKRDFYSVPGSDVILRAHSLTGLEALGLGLTVYNWDGEESDIDISKHRPENVIPLIWEVYTEEVKK
jgi:hypothetical protein